MACLWRGKSSPSPPNSLLPKIGALDRLSHGTVDLSLAFKLHSQALMVAFRQNNDFRLVTYDLPDMLRLVFNDDLGATNERNFLNHLVRHQAGVPGAFAADAMLDRFTGDLRKIAQNGGLTMADINLTKTLIAFSMQAYYDERLVPPNTLYTPVDGGGGIKFSRLDVADEISGAKGFLYYFSGFLTSLSKEERDAITEHIWGLIDWYVQAGTTAMTATASGQRALMLGGVQADHLTGGSQSDVAGPDGGNSLEGAVNRDRVTTK